MSLSPPNTEKQLPPLPPLPLELSEGQPTTSTTFAAAKFPPSSYSQLNTSSTISTSPPHHYSNDLTHPILEEGTETESESPNEPVTPVSGRQSQEFTTLHNQDSHDLHLQSDGLPPNAQTSPAAKPPLLINTAPTPSPKREEEDVPARRPGATPIAVEEAAPTPLSRRSTRGSTLSFKRSLSNMSSRVTLFRRGTSQSSKDLSFTPIETAASDTNLNGAADAKNKRRFSTNKSSATTRSNSPPSPSSPLEMAPAHKDQAAMPTTDDFKKKNRASTGLFSRRGVNFAGSNLPSRDKDKMPRQKRRASSFDGGNKAVQPASKGEAVPPERLPWPYPPDAGVGVKARRMSVSLPDDFTVDIAELLSEYEYQHKFFGRHGRHLGKGTTCKVTLMARKGCPNELYAVKEFRGKSARETQEEYEKKVKSEYMIAKSLHHPNIVETIRLCTDHGRWNHVMEYCAEGDLFNLVQKGYLKQEARQTDRYCLWKQLIQGVNYLHANGIAHRDIKLENLLITKDSKLKITDFGVSEVFSGIHPGLREAGGVCGKGMGEIRLCSPGICGSEPYIAPEVLARKDGYDARALDVWSSAIIMIYLIFGGAIWNKAQPGQPNYDALVKGWNRWNAKHAGPENETLTDTDYPNVTAFDKFVKPPALRRLLLQMLNPDPKKRMSVADVVNNRWMRNVECCQLESYEDPTPIDASKKNCTKAGAKKIYCHNHLPPLNHGTHSLGKMPGQVGYLKDMTGGSTRRSFFGTGTGI